MNLSAKPWLMTSLVILSLVINSTAAVLIAAWKVEKAQSFAGQDAMMICTGKTFKWVSLSAFEELGELKFIEPPENAPESVHEVDCSYSYLADNQSDNQHSLQDIQSYAAYKALTARLAQRPYTAFPYQQALSRAPPRA